MGERDRLASSVPTQKIPENGNGSGKSEHITSGQAVAELQGLSCHPFSANGHFTRQEALTELLRGF